MQLSILSSESTPHRPAQRWPRAAAVTLALTVILAGCGGKSGSSPLTGTLVGSKITFGTVGSLAITYTGSVLSDSMSGTYEVAGGHGSGHWSATKSR
jgi:hypothetical protein